MKKIEIFKILFTCLFVIFLFSVFAISAVALEDSEFNYESDIYSINSENDVPNSDENTENIIEQLYFEVGADELIFSVPEESREFLSSLRISDFSPTATDDLTFDALITGIGNIIKANIYEPVKVLITVLGIVFITALFDTMKTSSLSTSLDGTLSVVSTLCTVAIISPSLLGLIDTLSQTIINSSNFMLFYIPVISVLIITSGRVISGGSFYAIMIYISNAVLQITSKIILPLLKCIISLSIVSSVSDKVSLSGFINLFKKTVKWVLCFCMSIFVAFLTMKSIVNVSEDNISNKVAKFAINNFVPLVGGALSDAYQTVISCVGLLKSGVGVVAMIAVFAIFLPAVAKCLIWQFVLAISTAVCEVFEIKKTCNLLNSLSAVISTISAILLSIMVIYIISTAIIILVGG